MSCCHNGSAVHYQGCHVGNDHGPVNRQGPVGNYQGLVSRWDSSSTNNAQGSFGILQKTGDNENIQVCLN